MNFLDLEQLLKKLYTDVDETLRERFSRSLPFQDGLFDRWDRAKRLGFGNGSSIYNSALVFGDVRVGENTWIGPFVVLDGSGGLTIGSHCSISAGVQIYSHDTVEWAVSGGRAQPNRLATSIDDNCYIGPNTVIAKGIRIGTGCVIGANSLVLGDIEAGSKAYGTPCRVVGKVTPSNAVLPEDRR